MSTIAIPGGSGGTLYGVGRTFEYDVTSIITASAGETTAGWPGGLGAFTRGGDVNANINGTGVYSAGSAGGAGSIAGINYFRGKRSLYVGIKGALQTDIPRDFISQLSPGVVVERPAFTFEDWNAVFQVSALMGITAPALAITKDVGLILTHDPAVTNWPAGMRTNLAANTQAGFGVVFDGIAGTLAWISKRNAVVGVPDETVQLGIGQAGEFFHVAIRLVSATPTSDALVKVFVNGALKLTRSWSAGTLLPDRTSIATWAGSFRPYMRVDESSAGANVRLSLASWRFATAVSEDAMAR